MTLKDNLQSLKVRWLLLRLRHARKYGKPMPDTAQFAFSQSVYLGYDPADLEMLQAYRDKSRQAKPGYITDFFGVRTRVTTLPQSTHKLAGKVLGLPWPNDYLAESSEWIALIKSVDEARSQFNMMELGAGWGPWIIGGGYVARAKGIKDINLLGVEADKGHFSTMLDHFHDNGFDPADHMLLEGAVGTENGTAQWAVPEDPSEVWGHRPVRDGKDGDADRRYRNSTIGVLPMEQVTMFDIKELLGKRDFWNLVHIDIQGWEAEVMVDALADFEARAHRVMIGTHSRKIEAQLLDLLHAANWELEAEKPCQFTYYGHHPDYESMTVIDGFQCWRNPRLTPG